MKRRESIVLSLLSLALCICMATYWIRSKIDANWFLPVYGDPHSGQQNWLVLLDGEAMFAHDGFQVHPPDDPDLLYMPIGHDGHFFYYAARRYKGQYEWRLQVPVLLFVLLFGIAPAIWLRRIVRASLNHRRMSLERSRMSQRLCTSCGYDLRASKGNCPECGTAILKPQPEPISADATAYLRASAKLIARKESGDK
jgi:hypothetical protein